MSAFIAALPMYDWPETRAQTDAEWSRLRGILRGQGIDAPEHLVRRNGDLPPAPGGIRDRDGAVIAPDPATLPPDELDLPTLWRHPRLLFSQTCWGPMELGLADHVRVVGQPDYSAFEGGSGEFYSSAVIMRRSGSSRDALPPEDGTALLPLDLLRGARLAFNSSDSMSGWVGLMRDLAEQGQGTVLFSATVDTGGHHASIAAVAQGRADLCAIDCRSWAMARLYEPCAADLVVIGWTRRRKGLPFITALASPGFSLF